MKRCSNWLFWYFTALSLLKAFLCIPGKIWIRILILEIIKILKNFKHLENFPHFPSKFFSSFNFLTTLLKFKKFYLSFFSPFLETCLKLYANQVQNFIRGFLNSQYEIRSNHYLNRKNIISSLLMKFTTLFVTSVKFC